MSDHFTETTTISWGSRIMESIKGILVGLILFIVSFFLIFWNEGNSIDRAKALEEGRGIVVPTSSESVNNSNNNNLIHFSGEATSDAVLNDKFFGVSLNALKLKRNVEMYQWQETQHTKTKKNTGGSETKETTYDYSKVWSEQLISSTNFRKKEGHENPTTMPYKSQAFTAPKITVGAFTLSNAFTNQINNFTPYPVSNDHHAQMHPKLQEVFTVNSEGNYFYGNSNDPQIGSVRISYHIIEPQTISVIGKQNNNMLETYHAKTGEIALLEYGSVGAESMFKSAEQENMLITWLLRGGAILLMWGGLMLIFRPIAIVGDFIPLLGSVMGAGIGIVTFIISLVLSFITMALAWITYNPLVGGGLFAVAAFALFVGIPLLKKKVAQRSQASATTQPAPNQAPPQPASAFPTPPAPQSPPSEPSGGSDFAFPKPERPEG